MVDMSFPTGLFELTVLDAGVRTMYVSSGLCKDMNETCYNGHPKSKMMDLKVV